MNQQRKVNGGRAVMSEGKWKTASEGWKHLGGKTHLYADDTLLLLLLQTLVNGRVWEVISA